LGGWKEVPPRSIEPPRDAPKNLIIEERNEKPHTHAQEDEKKKIFVRNKEEEKREKNLFPFFLFPFSSTLLHPSGGMQQQREHILCT
jgi:hypothetical protein